MANGGRLVALSGADTGTFIYDFGVVASVVPDLSDWSKLVFAVLLAFAGLLVIRRL